MVSAGDDQSRRVGLQPTIPTIPTIRTIKGQRPTAGGRRNGRGRHFMVPPTSDAGLAMQPRAGKWPLTTQSAPHEISDRFIQPRRIIWRKIL